MQLLGFTKRKPKSTYDKWLVGAVKRMQRKVGFKRADRDGVYGPWTALALENHVKRLG
jgi:murein L,D-transpeptidase YcbB/YkuD